MTDQMNPAERLRDAATLLRERAGGTTWVPECGRWWVPGLSRGEVAEADVDVAFARNDRIAAYIATMHPGVALALADWLDDVADNYAIAQYGYWSARASAVADAVLGGEQSSVIDVERDECNHEWVPLDLPDPMSAGAVIHCGSVCRECGLEES